MIGAFHALLEVSGHRSLFFRAMLSSNESAVVPTAMLSDRGHPRFQNFNFHYHYWIFMKWTQAGFKLQEIFPDS